MGIIIVMIKTIPLLRETYSTFKANFKKIFIMALPILIITYVISYGAGNLAVLVDGYVWNGMTALFAVVTVISVLLTALFFGPALNRAIQRNEDVALFDTKEGYRFQTNHIGRWIMVNVWGFLYLVWRMLPYVIPMAILLFAIRMLGMSELVETILAALAALILVVGLVRNVTRFLLFKTIMFSKEISARNAVRESMALGVSKNKDLWKLFLALILLGLAVVGFSIIAGMIAGFAGFSRLAVDTYVVPLIDVFIVTPMILILTAKAYAKVRTNN